MKKKLLLLSLLTSLEIYSGVKSETASSENSSESTEKTQVIRTIHVEVIYPAMLEAQDAAKKLEEKISKRTEEFQRIQGEMNKIQNDLMKNDPEVVNENKMLEQQKKLFELDGILKNLQGEINDMIMQAQSEIQQLSNNILKNTLLDYGRKNPLVDAIVFSAAIGKKPTDITQEIIEIINNEYKAKKTMKDSPKHNKKDKKSS